MDEKLEQINVKLQEVHTMYHMRLLTQIEVSQTAYEHMRQSLVAMIDEIDEIVELIKEYKNAQR
jgi:hypothetical protein